MNKGGTIKKLPNGKYMWVGYFKDENGKIHRPNRTFKTLKEAEEHRKTEEDRALIANKLKTGRDYTFKEYFELWKALTWQDETYYSFTTIDRWKSVFDPNLPDVPSAWSPAHPAVPCYAPACPALPQCALLCPSMP